MRAQSIYKFLLFTVSVFVISCANPSSEDICLENPCKELNRNICNITGESFSCSCNPGYRDKYGSCIKDASSNHCSPNPCIDENRNICNSNNGFPVCLCNENYHDENGVCKLNSLQCQVDEHEEAGSCSKNTKFVDCKIITPPDNASLDEVSLVEITWTAGVWSNPSDCTWTCNENYHKDGDLCKENALECETDEHEEDGICVSNVKNVDCKAVVAPENAILNPVIEVEIHWVAGAWTEASDCTWTCKENYHADNGLCKLNTLECQPNQHEEEGVCVSNTKMLACNNNTPATGINIDAQVEVHYIEGSGWQTPSDCDWTCSDGYNKNSLGCTQTPNPGAECSSHELCYGENSFCANYTNNGYCTASCASDGEVCMDTGFCSSGSCYKSCIVGNDSSCSRTDLICVDEGNNIGGLCRTRCYADNECNTGYCNMLSGHCEINYTTCNDDLVNNSGCNASNTCLDDNGSTYCYPNNSKVNGESCEYSNDCIAQYGCLGNINNGYTCKEYCRVDSDCSNGPKCSSPFAGKDYGYCLYDYENCNSDPVNNSGCGVNEICFNEGGTYCIAGSGKVAGEACQYSNDCIAGYGCVGSTTSPYVCKEYCRSVSDCSLGSLCTMFSGENFGYCN